MLNLAWKQLPHKRNQDIVKVFTDIKGYVYVVSVTDGWNDTELSGDVPGRKVATIVAKDYPKIFSSLRIQNIDQRARDACEKIDKKILKLYPQHATCVAMFLFHSRTKNFIISVGDVETYVWNRRKWYKPKEMSDHWLDLNVYPSNVSRFFGGGNRKKDSRFPGIFSAEPDIIEISPTTPVIIATDGIKDVLSLSDINAIVGNPEGFSPKEIVEKMSAELKKRKRIQKDDISILVRN